MTVDENNLDEEELHFILKLQILWIEISACFRCAYLTILRCYLLYIQQNNIHEEGLQKMEVVTENVRTVAKDPRYARYLKMVQVVSQFFYHSLSTPIIFRWKVTYNCK